MTYPNRILVTEDIYDATGTVLECNGRVLNLVDCHKPGQTRKIRLFYQKRSQISYMFDELLFSKLFKRGLIIEAPNVQKFVPKQYETFFYVSEYIGSVEQDMFVMEESKSFIRALTGNCFKTREDAEKMALIIKKNHGRCREKMLRLHRNGKLFRDNNLFN